MPTRGASVSPHRIAASAILNRSATSVAPRSVVLPFSVHRYLDQGIADLHGNVR
jgi:hypothetical protein